MVKSYLILSDKPNAVANLKIVGLKDFFLFNFNMYFSISTFDFAYKERGLRLLDSVRYFDFDKP